MEGQETQLTDDLADANQPALLGPTSSGNIIAFEISDPDLGNEENHVHEDSRIFGTHILEAKRILRNAFGKSNR